MLLRRFALALIGFTATSAQIILLREFISTFHGNELVIGVYLCVWLLATALGSGVVGWGFSPGASSRNTDSGSATAPSPGAGTGSAGSASSQANVGSGATVRTSPAVRFAVVECLAGLSLILALVGLSLPPAALRPAPGETTGLLAALACAGLFLTPFCLLQGLLFPLGTGLMRDGRAGASVSRVYLLEAFGAAVGGLLVSLLLVHVLSSFQNIAIICAGNLLTAGALLETSSRRHLRHACSILAGAALVVCILDPVTLWVTSSKWGAFKVVDVRQSRYGKLVVIAVDSQFSVYQDGLLVFTTEDLKSAEEAAHISLLQHPSPKNVLLIGGGIGGVSREALKHSAIRRLDYVELDPELIALSQETLPEQYVPELDDPRLKVHLTDGRRFLGRSAEQYDVVVMQIPPPYTAQLNRFYTREFFATVRDRLGSGGVFVFSAPGVAEYIGDDLGAFLGSLAATAESVFGETGLIPAGKTFFVSSPNENPYVTAKPESLLSRLAVRDVQTLYVRDYFLISSFSPERLAYVQESIAAHRDSPVNLDLKPTSFFYGLILWSAEYERFIKVPLRWLFENSWSLWVVVFGAAVALSFSGVAVRHSGAAEHARLLGGQKRILLSALAVSGFAAIVLELEVVLSFQLLYGGLYERIGILLTSYMIGLAAGTTLERRRVSSKRGVLLRPALIQGGTAVFASCFFGIVYAISGVSGRAPAFLEWLFPFFAVVAGALGGALFSSASRAFFQLHSSIDGGEAVREEGSAVRVSSGGASSRSMGVTYAWDLVGSCVGAAVCSAVLFPVAGIGSTTGMVAVLLAASGASLVLSGFSRPESHSAS